MSQAPKSNVNTVTIEVNGQQQELIEKLVASDPAKRPAEELIRYGFSEFVKMKRLGIV
jgi:hypothetical protein